MLNVLVIENDPVICKRLVNGIIQYVKNVRICGISYTAKEAIEISNRQKIDIAILDYNLKENSASSYIEFVSENNNKSTNKISLILLAEKNKLDDKSYENEVYKVIYRPIQIAQLIYAIRELSNCDISANQKLIKNKIFKELEKLQYNFSYVGTQYMAEAIYEIYSKKYIYSGGNLNKNVYPIIAQKHNTTVNNVKCNITSATKIMSEKCSKDIMENYLFCENSNKPKVKEIMYKVINKL